MVDSKGSQGIVLFEETRTCQDIKRIEEPQEFYGPDVYYN